MDYEYERNIISTIIKTKNFNSYCEIGYAQGCTFNIINVAEKIAIDPSVDNENVVKLTSDDFFTTNNRTFDAFFVDGDHEYKQVLRDVHNCLKFLNSNGIVFIHDVYPKYDFQLSPSACFNSFRAFLKLKTNPDINLTLFEGGYGLGLVQKGKQDPITLPKDFDLWSDLDSYHYFLSIKNDLNILTLEEFLSL